MINTPWICVLEAFGYDRLVLNGQGDNNLPDGWAEKRVNIKRSPTYYGLNRIITTSVKFVTNGKDYVQRIYENEGTEFKINIAWYEYNELPTDKYLLFFAGLVDLSVYDIQETFIECDINESSMARKFMSRDDVKVNLSTIESIEGVSLPVNNEVTVQLHEREIKKVGVYELNEEAATVTSEGSPLDPLVKGFSLPIRKVTSDISNLVEPTNPGFDQANTIFWSEADLPSTFTITGRIVGTMGISPTDTQSVNHYLSFRIYTDNTYASWIDNVIWSFDGELEPGQLVDVDLNLQFNTINTDQVIALIAYSDQQFGSYTSEFTEIDITIEQNELVDTTQAQGYLMHEVGERISQVILDKENAFKSDFLGRTDIGYPVDGAGSKQTVHSGKQIRAIPSEHPSLNFKDWFTSINAQHSMGAGIEHDQFNAPFLRVEEKAHFFSGDVVATIHSVNNFKKSVAREWIYNEVEVGYAKAEYEEVNGLEEYNNKFEWASSIRTIKNKLDLVSKLRADGYGIEFARRLQFDENPTEDSKYDNENFTVIVKEDGANYRSAKAEDYDIVENIFSPETAYNLDITPGRMLRNNGSVIRAGLEHYLTDPLKFQFAEQKANLKSQRIGEASITENEDIDVSTLAAGLWIAEIYSFENVLTREQLAAITKNQNGIVKFSTTTLENTTKYYYGWILDTPTEPENDTAEIQLLRVNTSNPDVKLVDPEGSTPTQPPIIVDPSTVIGVFEGPFEFIFSG